MHLKCQKNWHYTYIFNVIKVINSHKTHGYNLYFSDQNNLFRQLDNIL